MAVTEDERRIGAAARGDERVDERPFGALDDLGLPTAAPEELDEPVGRGANVGRVVRVGADARNAQELTSTPASVRSGNSGRIFNWHFPIDPLDILMTAVAFLERMHL